MSWRIVVRSVGYLLLAMVVLEYVRLGEGSPLNAEDAQKKGRGYLYRRLMLPPAAPGELPRSVKELSSNSSAKRVKAAVEILQARSAVSHALVVKLRKLSKNPEPACMSEFHITVLLAGRSRLEKSVAVLIPLIDFSLDPQTLPVGDRYPSEAYYPVASALSEIGGLAVFEGVLSNLSKPSDERRLRVSAWVLKESLGAAPSKAVVRAALDDASNEQHKKNLSSVLTLLAEEVILRHPAR